MDVAQLSREVSTDGGDVEWSTTCNPKSVVIPKSELLPKMAWQADQCIVHRKIMIPSYLVIVYHAITCIESARTSNQGVQLTYQHSRHEKHINLSHHPFFNMRVDLLRHIADQSQRCIFLRPAICKAASTCNVVHLNHFSTSTKFHMMSNFDVNIPTCDSPPSNGRQNFGR